MNPLKWSNRVVALALWLGISLAACPAADLRGFRLSLQEFLELDCQNCDGVALGDISGNGKTDILLSNGNHGETFWYEQGGSYREWKRRPIYQMELLPGDRSLEIEGNDLADFDRNGRLEAVSLEQTNGRIYIHRHDGDPRGKWKTAMIRDGRPLVQSSLVADIDGDGRPDLIYAWEGRARGEGGIHWLKFVGTDVLNPDHWRDHAMVQHESAWWIAPRRIDLNGNGRKADIVFSARNYPSRNPGTRPGVFWLSEPADDVTRPWKRHVIDDTLAQPSHVDIGDLSGDGHGKDVVVGSRPTTTEIYWYSFTENWKRHAIPVPKIADGVQPVRTWNVKTARFGGDRDGIFAVVAGPRWEDGGAFMFFEFLNGRFRPNVLFRFDYIHPMDDRIILHDIDGNGIPEAFIPDSGFTQDRTGIDRMIILKFDWDDKGNIRISDRFL